MVRNKDASVCAIIVTCSGQKITLKNLLKACWEGITIVYNRSTDNTLTILMSFEEIYLIENLGFGKANNLALKKAYLEGFEYFLWTKIPE